VKSGPFARGGKKRGELDELGTWQDSASGHDTRKDKCQAIRLYGGKNGRKVKEVQRIVCGWGVDLSHKALKERSRVIGKFEWATKYNGEPCTMWALAVFKGKKNVNSTDCGVRGLRSETEYGKKLIARARTKRTKKHTAISREARRKKMM